MYEDAKALTKTIITSRINNMIGFHSFSMYFVSKKRKIT